MRFFFVFVFFVFPMVFTKPTNHSRKTKITKENQNKTKNIRNNPKTIKGFRLTLGYGFDLFCFVGFPGGFYKTNKSFEKTQIPKKTNKLSGKPKKEKKTNP